MSARYSSQEMITKLVGFDTTSRNSNLELITFVKDYLQGWGVESQLVFNDDGSKANLYATLGASTTGGVVLSGHTDVVPVDGQNWTSDPFSVVEREGCLFGRGTADMKSFFSIALAKVPNFLNAPLSMPVHFALSYDEEVGCLGAPDMIAHMCAHLPRPRLVIVGEPTLMKVVNAHKGIHAFTTTVTGREAHSSATHIGANAVMAAGELIYFLSNCADAMMQKGGDPGGRFDPPYTSLQVGTVNGGTALNIIPKHCSFEWEFRPLPDQDPEEITGAFERFAREVVLPKLRRNSSQANIETQAHMVVPALVPSHNHAGEALALLLAQQNELHAVSYGTEAGQFQAADIPTIVCGPGDILQAHRPDEFIALSQVKACEAFMDRLIAHVQS